MTDAILLNALASLGVTPESIAYTRGLGIDECLIEPHCGFVAVSLGNLFSGPAGNVFRLSNEGRPIVIVGALDAHETVSDLVAWPLYGSNRTTWATLRLEAELLGIPQALRHRQTGQPLKLCRSPESWLMDGFDGSCVVSKRHGAHWLNTLPGPFVAEDVDHGRELATLLKPYGKAHLIHVPAPEAREAA